MTSWLALESWRSYISGNNWGTFEEKFCCGGQIELEYGWYPNDRGQRLRQVGISVRVHPCLPPMVETKPSVASHYCHHVYSHLYCSSSLLFCIGKWFFIDYFLLTVSYPQLLPNPLAATPYPQWWAISLNHESRDKLSCFPWVTFCRQFIIAARKVRVV